MLNDDQLHAEQAAEDTRETEATQVVETTADKPKSSLWSRLRGGGFEERLYNLNWAVAAYPDVAANYVLRGELLLEHHDLVQAIADFRRGLELAAAQTENDDWGVVGQAVQDRALVGLRDALRRAARYNHQTD